MSRILFGGASGAFQPTVQTGWDTLKLLTNGHTLKSGAEGNEREAFTSAVFQKGAEPARATCGSGLTPQALLADKGSHSRPRQLGLSVPNRPSS